MKLTHTLLREGTKMNRVTYLYKCDLNETFWFDLLAESRLPEDSKRIKIKILKDK